MTNVCAAIGLAQLEQANSIIDKKRKIADTYYKHFENSTKVTMLREENNLRNSYWMVCLLFENKDIKNAVRIKLAENRIESRPLFPPVHTMPMYKDENIIAPIANDLSNNGVNLPSFVNLDSDKINKICEIIKKSI
jgi:perosamine synthetase